ncbi:serine protease inhibitor 42Dd-like isoform X3 [Phlebotomus argentipes]|uniref:serine protease inhibitor 42Dd-like isoform X3 n=1 Tax=Phlebotomus argentipes TaxID=94469 RepID=UPI002892C870|nr:serine protease inhibitor 42Dd-like isoform X3 [Phlebotomus argentipes]
MKFSLLGVLKGIASVTTFVLILAISSTMADPVPVSKGFSKFAIQLYQECVAEKGGNVIISPFSVQSAVSLALMGATGDTAREMATTMGYASADKNAIADNFASLLTTYKDSPLLKIANKVYVMNKYHVKAQFNELATKKFNSEAQSLDFADNVNSAKTINTWVEDKTNNKIKDLVPSDALNSDTRLVLVNAIYFKGLWENKFKPENTKKLPFWTTKDNSVDVDMMNTKADFKYGVFDDLDAVALEMPYKDSDLSMLIILPNQRDGLPNLEKALSGKDLSEITSQMYKTEVIVHLPKFKIEYDIELNKVLSKMGMARMFSDAAEFGDLLEEADPLKVSKVLHKAFIEVNEEGAEAAAATAFIMKFGSAPGPVRKLRFTVDHPFFFVIRSEGWDTSIFSGSVSKLL